MEPGCNSKYIGESHNNFMTRSNKHKDKYMSNSFKNRGGTFIYKWGKRTKYESESRKGLQ